MPVLPDPLKFVEAIAWAAGRVELTKPEWEKLSAEARRRAFTVAAVAQADVLHDVRKAVDSAVDVGTTLEDFKKAVGEKLEGEWAGSVANPAWRIETIFRTNVQSAYAAGRFKQATEPDTLAVRPVWMFDTIMDSRTSPICAKCNGVTLPADDPWWKDHQPPLHHACRSTVIALTEEQAKVHGVTEKAPRSDPAKGFGAPPTEHEWSPDFDRYHDDLRKQLQKKLDAAPKPTAAPAPETVRKTA